MTMTTAEAPRRPRTPLEQLHAALDQVAHWLPDQGPINVFVHHNTLHAFEHLPFHQAVQHAQTLYAAQGYWPEATFRAALHAGRIDPQDLQVELANLKDAQEPVALPWGLTRQTLRLARLTADLQAPGGALAWQMSDGGEMWRFPEALAVADRHHLVRLGQTWLLQKASEPLEQAAVALTGEPNLAAARAIWQGQMGLAFETAALVQAVHKQPERWGAFAMWTAANGAARRAAAPAGESAKQAPAAPRDLLLAATGVDAHELVHRVLQRWTAAHLDQGMAYWPMPQREKGLYLATRELWLQPLAAPRELAEVTEVLADHHARGLDAAQACLDLLRRLQVAESATGEWVTRLLLALPGWSGMVARLQHHPLEAAGGGKVSLVDFLALRLLLEWAALRQVAREQLGDADAWQSLKGTPETEAAPAAEEQSRLAWAWSLARLAAHVGRGPADLEALQPGELAELAQEWAGFGDLLRRQVWLQAFERWHRRRWLDALWQHRRLGLEPDPPQPAAQVVFCLDEREESMRRALETLAPQYQTYGAAGFFGLAMVYQGLDDPRPVPLCPVGVEPQHLVQELPMPQAEPAARAARLRRQRWGTMALGTGVASRSLLRATLLSAAGGALAAIPMALRLIAPGRAESVAAVLRGWIRGEVATRLTFERQRPLQDADGLWQGFSGAEQIDRVAGLLTTLGLVRGFAPLVAILGHASQSLNNPHLSAYQCGACGGRSGLANARLFAQLANLPEVRRGLRQRGIDIPETTWFIGGVHDTATEHCEFADLQALPASHRGALGELQNALQQARQANAHERCRRFGTAPARLTPAQALEHVRTRAVDLAEARPEYGHSSNAIAVFGRRQLTRHLFMDRRAFLVSYDPELDVDGSILEKLLAGAGVVGAGISLEYYFSTVDNQRYGSGTKLPHNLVGLIGVMDGAGSDLRTGLNRQMIEIHEPMRLLTIVEATPEVLMGIAARQPAVGRLVAQEWIQLVSVDPHSGAMAVFSQGRFAPYEPGQQPLPQVRQYSDGYSGRSGHLGPMRLAGAGGQAKLPSEVAHAA